MKRIGLWILALTATAPRVAAHPGHGHGGGWEPSHYLFEPQHAVWAGAAVVCLGGLWMLARRLTSSPKAGARAHAAADRRDRPDATASD